MPLILGLSGSLRQKSYTRMALHLGLEGARQMGATPEFLDLRSYNLPLCLGQKADQFYPEDVFRLRAEVRAAEGLILATPEYHGSFSGVLKNALDLLDIEDFEGKPVGLIGVSAGRMGAFEALNGLRAVGRALHAWVLPEQVAIPEAYKAFDECGNCRNDEFAERLRELGCQVARFAQLQIHHAKPASAAARGR